MGSEGSFSHNLSLCGLILFELALLYVQLPHALLMSVFDLFVAHVVVSGDYPTSTPWEECEE